MTSLFFALWCGIALRDAAPVVSRSCSRFQHAGELTDESEVRP